MGGAQYQAHLLATELAGRPGVTVTYVGRQVPDSVPPGTLPYRVRRIGSGKGIRHRAVAFDARSLLNALKELQPDAIYQRMKQSYTGICAMYARKAGIPLIFHAAHDLDLKDSFVRRFRPTNLPFDIVEEALGNYGVRRAPYIIVQTQRQRSLLVKHFGREPTAVMPNFQPMPDTLPPKRSDKVRIAWVANFKHAKRPELFVKLAQHFANRPDIEFLMAGDLPKHRQFRALAEAVERTPNLQYFGALSIDKVNELMADSDVFVSTSRYEGFPNTFIQAWARGAVIASLTVDIDGGLDAQAIGFHAEEFEGLVALIEKLAASPDLRRATATRAFAFVRENYSLRSAARLADLILDTPETLEARMAAEAS